MVGDYHLVIWVICRRDPWIVGSRIDPSGRCVGFDRFYTDSLEGKSEERRGGINGAERTDDTTRGCNLVSCSSSASGGRNLTNEC